MVLPAVERGDADGELVARTAGHGLELFGILLFVAVVVVAHGGPGVHDGVELAVPGGVRPVPFVGERRVGEHLVPLVERVAHHLHELPVVRGVGVAGLGVRVFVAFEVHVHAVQIVPVDHLHDALGEGDALAAALDDLARRRPVPVVFAALRRVVEAEEDLHAVGFPPVDEPLDLGAVAAVGFGGKGPVVGGLPPLEVEVGEAVLHPPALPVVGPAVLDRGLTGAVAVGRHPGDVDGGEGGRGQRERDGQRAEDLSKRGFHFCFSRNERSTPTI